MSPDDMQRFQIDATSWNYGGASLNIRHDCGWYWESECPDEGGGEVTLAELVQRAEEHTEVCQ